MPERPLPRLPPPRARRAVVIGAGSFGTAVAVLLARGGMRTTLQARTAEQAERLAEERRNDVYLPGIELPRELRVEPMSAGLGTANVVFLGVPSRGLDEVIGSRVRLGLTGRAAVVSLAKGLVPPDGLAPSIVLRERFGPERVAVIGGPAHAREMVHEGAGLVAASTSEELAGWLQQMFLRAGVVCELSNDPVGVELAGAAKNAAALAAAAAAPAGPNVAGAAAGKVLAEIDAYGRERGADAGTFAGLAGAGDLVATVLADGSRNRRAGELLAAGVPGPEIGERLGHAAEAVDSVPLLLDAVREHGLDAPALASLAALIEGRVEPARWAEGLTGAGGGARRAAA